MPFSWNTHHRQQTEALRNDEIMSEQPSINQAYETSGNPTDKSSREQSKAQLNSQTDDDNAVAHRSPGKAVGEDQATGTSVARGVRGAPAGEEARGYTQQGLDSQELDAEQMGAPGEGKVESAVNRKPGASGNEQGFETDLDKKKAEQAPAREKEKEKKAQDVDVGGVLGQRGGPANPVD